jgi:AmmeMemoRadiSam system protein A
MSRLSEKPSENLAARDVALPPSLQELSLEQRRILLHIAHEAILGAVERRPVVDVPPSDPRLSEPRGVFTTLYLPSELHHELHYELRGCVGYAVPVAPLHRAVAETACAAAFEDSRFLPVTKDEAPLLEVSLSVLSRLSPIHPETVEVGRHGLIISQGPCRGLLLPQVPVEQGWDRETFLEQACRKAGLPLDAWRKGAAIEVFTAEVFSDPEVEDSG